MTDGVRMMPELFVFKLYTALIFNYGEIFSQKPANSKKMPVSFPLAEWRNIYTRNVYTQTAYTWTTVRMDSPHTTSDSAEH